jgi:hypothetical protein
MILTADYSQQLVALRVYSITYSGRMTPLLENEDEWLGRELEVTVTLSGYGTTNDKATPTWQSSATDSDVGAAFARALAFAPAQREECDLRAAGRLGEILPEYDPDGTRFAKRPRVARTAKKKISADELAQLLGL